MEELLGQVRDAGSRTELAEAIRAYQAGAFRAALISTWVTVALDVVAKLREVADSGDAAAQRWVGELDSAIEANDIPRLQRIESGLLDAAHLTFQLVGTREYEELRRLYQDRHVCAHPAFVAPDEVFTPTAELVRAHIGAAVDTLLRHGPTPGKWALDRFLAETKASGWPAEHWALAQYLEAQFLARGTESLRRNLATVVVKGCLAPPDGDLGVSDRLAEAAHALAQTRPALLDEACERVIRRWEEGRGLTDPELRRLVGALGDLPAAWTALPESSVSRVIAVLNASTHEQLLGSGAYGRNVALPEVARVIDERFSALTEEQLGQVVKKSPRYAMIDRALELVDSAKSFRTAELAFANLVPLAPFLDVRALQRLTEIFKKSDGQLRNAAEVPPYTETVFEAAPHNREMLDVWRELALWLRVQQEDPEHYYAYPGLYERVHAAGS